MSARALYALLPLALLLAPAAGAQPQGGSSSTDPGSAEGGAPAKEDVGPGAPAFEEGDVLGLEDVRKLEPYLPPEFWANRDFFFYEGMKLEVGPFHRDYAPAKVYRKATERFAGEPRIGPEESLENYTAGQPFPMEEIDCKNDPEAGTKIIWNFDYQWTGAGADASFYYSYWDRGQELPLYYEGTSKTIKLAHRSEPQHLEDGGDVFRNEKRKYAFGINVTAPFESRGTRLMTYRYKSSDAPPAEAKNDDTWVYLPNLRRVRRVSAAQRTDAVAGTDFTFDDLRSFSGIPPQYEWTCLGETKLMAPMNAKTSAYPYDEDENFGPYGLSYADGLWEMRNAVKIRFEPKNPDHPYDHKDIYLDRQTLAPLYSFAYDVKGELWKIIWHNHRWSGTTREWSPDDWYTGWKNVPEPQDLITVSDTIVNVQTGTGNRIEFWDNDGTPMRSKGEMRRYISISRLTRGR